MALTNELNGLLQSQGLTAQQAQETFGLPSSSTDWMKNIGVQFATASAAPTAPAVQAPSAATPPAAKATGAPGSLAAPVQPGAATAGLMEAVGYDSVNADARLRDPANTFTPGADATVEGRIQGLIASGSPLNTLAETRALQKANKFGLANSSMAVQAGQTALYDAALPIAQQDAAMFASTGQFNADARNRRDSENAQLGTQVTLANADAGNTARQFTASAQNATREFNARNITEVSKFNATAALQAGIVNQEQANRMEQFNSELLTRVNLENVRNENELQQFLLNQQLQAGIINQEQANRMAQFNTALSADISRFNSAELNALTKLGIDSQTKLQLADIEASYKTLMQTSASASDLYKTMLQQIATIQTNKDMGASAKQQAIANLTGVLNASLGVIGDVSNLDLPELNFNGDGFGEGGAPAPTNGAFPSTIGGQPVDWDTPIGVKFGNITPKSPRDRYEDYKAQGGTLSPEQWWLQNRG